jgi:hypothetical protein
VIFLLKLICNILILIFIFISGTYLWHWVELNFFTTWDAHDAWFMIALVIVVYGIIASSVLFSIVEGLLSSSAARK